MKEDHAYARRRTPAGEGPYVDEESKMFWRLVVVMLFVILVLIWLIP